ncbi:polysaccharide deacetylase family protein [Altericroceibacterium indicum]
MRSIIDAPPVSALAQFQNNFGKRFLLTVDTEEEFDWAKPLSRNEYDLRHVVHIGRFQQFCEGEGITPVYLIDWPIANSELAVKILGPALESGKAEVGIQLHPWVNPPFEEEVTQQNSFAGNLTPTLERSKFRLLRDMIESRFGTAPVMYRAGRYGAGPNTSEILRSGGIAIDSSVRPKFNYRADGGPDYTAHPVAPYWLDDEHQLLELPLTTVFSGLLRATADTIYPAFWRAPFLRGVFSRLGLMERIPLTPEGISADEAIRAINLGIEDSLPLLVFSLHSPSLAPGHTPYVRNDADLDRLYEWFRLIFSHLRNNNVQSTSVRMIMENVVR